MKHTSALRARVLASALAALLAAPSAQAQTTRYWDGNDNSADFGSASGTWAVPTTGTATSGWTTDATGATAINLNSITTLINDPLHFGTDTASRGLGGGTITVSGTVDAASLRFGSQTTGNILLSGGTINLAATTSIHVGAGGSTVHTISSNITGAGTSLTKTGNALTLSGANTYTGSTIISSGTLTLGSTGALGTTPGVNGTSGVTIGGASAATLSSTLTGITIAAPITTANSGVNSTISFSRSTSVVGSLTLNGVIGGAGNVIFSTPNVASGNFQQTIHLGAASTYTGNTTITSGSIQNTMRVQAGIANALPTTTVLTLDGGDGTGSGRTTAYDLNGFSQTLAGLTNNASVNGDRIQEIQNTAGTAATLTVNDVTNRSFSGKITGTNLSLTKDGTGTWTLSGANGYSGATTVNEGKLIIGGGSLGDTAITVNNAGSTFAVTPGSGTINLGTTAAGTVGSTLNLTSGTSFSMVDGAIGTANLQQNVSFASSGLTLSGASLNFEVGAATADKLAVTKAATVSGSNLINVAGVTSMGGGPYNLITAASGLAGTYNFGGSGTTSQTVAVGTNAYLLTLGSSATAVTVTVGAATAIASGVTWTGQTNGTGAANSNWDNAISSNWAAGTTASAVSNGTAVTFGDTNAADSNAAISNSTVTVAPSGVAPTSTTFNNASVNYTVGGGAIGGAGNLTKSGTGTLVLDQANTYTGGTAITAGTLKLSGAGTVGPVGASVAVSSGALLDLNGTNRSIVFTGTGAGTVANNSGGGTSILTLSAAPVASSSIVIADNTNSSSGKVAVVIAVNTQTLSNSNTYSGGTTVNGGAFLYIASGLGAGSGTITLTASNSSLVANNGATIANDITGAGNVSNNVTSGGTITLTGSLTNSGGYTFRNAGNIYDFAGNGTTSSLSGVIGLIGGVNGTSSGGSIKKSGTGTLTLSGNSIYTGTTTITGGTLKLGATGSGANTPLGTAAGRTLVSGTGTLDLAGFTLATAEALSLAGTGTSGSGALANTGGAATYSGLVTLTGATSIVSDGNIVLSNTGTITGAGHGLTLGGTATGSSVGSIIGTTTGTLTKEGSGTWTLSGANTYTGDTTVSSGTLAVNGSLANTATLVTSATSARLQGSGLIVGPVTIGDKGTLAAGNSIESLGMGAVTFNAGSTFAFELQTDLFAVPPPNNVSADLIFSSGTLFIDSDALLTLNDLSTTALPPGSKLTLISYTGAAPSGRFTYSGSTLPDGGLVPLGANTWQFDYDDTTGGPNYAADQTGADGFFTMTVVPEAGTAGLLALGLLLLRRLRRR